VPACAFPKEAVSHSNRIHISAASCFPGGSEMRTGEPVTLKTHVWMNLNFQEEKKKNVKKKKTLKNRF